MEVNQIFYLKKGCVHVCIALIAAGPRVDQREQLLPRDRESIYTAQHLVQGLGFCALIRGCQGIESIYTATAFSIELRILCSHQGIVTRHVPQDYYQRVQKTVFNGFQFQYGPSFLFIPWSACWAILHFIGLGLQPYFHKDNELDLKWFSYLTYWGYTSLALFTAWDCAAAVYVHIRRQDIVKNGEDLQPRGPLF